MIVLRPYQPDDLAALAALWPGRSAAALDEHLDDPGLDPKRDLRVALIDGRIVAARDVRVMARGREGALVLESVGATSDEAWSIDHPAQGAGSPIPVALFGWMLERAAVRLAEHGDAIAVLQVRTAPEDHRTRELFESFGLAQARMLWSMEHRAPGVVEVTALPEGIQVRPYAPGRHDAAWVSAFNESFADHWGGWMQMSPERWRRYLARPSFRPELSLVAWSRDEIAGFCHCRLDESRAVGTVRYVGVRPAWRRLGLGEALTRLGLRTLAAAGAERVTLGVDATSTTGAHLLYQRLGFTKTHEQLMYRKELTR